jgi:hypothetical protein
MAQTWAFVAANAGATGSNPVLTVPAGYAAGNSLFIVHVNTNSATPTTPTGWDLSFSYSTGTNRLFIYQKIASSSESSVTLTVTAATSCSVMLCYTNVLSFQAGVGATLNTTATQTVTGDTLLFDIYGAPAGGNFNAPLGTTLRFDNGTVFSLSVCDEFFAGGQSGTTTTARTGGGSRSPTFCAAVAFNQSNGGFRMF